ncbi:MAG: helix-turn-helix domain-containing protein [Lactobacillus sp.]|nr:helix-turn-helix domain-containing protein [Lactobacillus sp.]MCI2033422.1 helix-turn-helix domain-containing protein [Lactobacillus sp.]
MFTPRQLAIIQVLIDTDMFISGTDLAKRVGISVKTLQKEMHQIQALLASYQIEIITQRGKGYFLKVDSKVQAEIFLNSIAYFSQVEDTENYDVEYMIVRLIQEAYVTHGWVTIADFEEAMFVGRKYIRGLLGTLKAVLAQYQVKLVLRQGQGMTLCGDALHVQLLLCEMQARLGNRILYGQPITIAATDQMIEEIRRRLMVFNISLSYARLERLAVFILSERLIVPDAPLRRTDASVAAFEQMLIQSPIGMAALELLQFYAIEPVSAILINTSKVILCSIERDALQPFSDLITASAPQERAPVAKIVAEVLQPNAALFQSDLQTVTACAVNAIMLGMLERRLGLVNHAHNVRNIGGKTMLCEFLSARILQAVGQHCHVPFDASNVGPLKLLLRAQTITYTEASGQNLYVIAKSGTSIAEYIAKNLAHEYFKFVHTIEAKEAVDSTIRQGDIIVTDLPLANFFQYDHVLYFTSLEHYDEVKISVGNYFAMTSAKSQRFFDALDLSQFNPDQVPQAYVAQIQQLRGFSVFRHQLATLDALRAQFHLFVHNGMAVLLLFDDLMVKDITITPILHRQLVPWHGQAVKLTFVVRLKHLEDFIQVDRPLFDLWRDKTFRQQLIGGNLSRDAFQEALNSAIL